MNPFHPTIKFAVFAGGAPGPSKPINPNGLKPVMLGLPQPQNGGNNTMSTALLPGQQGQEAIDPAELQKSEESAHQAKLQAQTAQAQAQMAKAQMQLNQQQSQQHQQTSTAAAHVGRSMVGKTVSDAVARIGKMRMDSLKSRINPGIKLATDPTAPGPWTPEQQAHYDRQARIESGMMQPGDFFSAENKMPQNVTVGNMLSAAGNTLKDYVKNPMGRTDVFDPSAPVMSGQYRPGSVGSAVQGTANFLGTQGKHVLNFLPRVADAAVGTVSYPLQAAAKVPNTLADWGKSIWNHPGGIGAGILDLQPFQSGYAQEALGHAAEGGKSLMTTALNTTPVGMGLNFALPQAASAVSNMLHPQEQQPAAPAQPAPETTASASPDIMAWLQALWAKIQPYLTDPRPWQAARAALPSANAGGGHRIPNLNHFL